MTNVVFPSDFPALLTLILNQAWISILISIAVARFPLWRKEQVADWIKVTAIAGVCLIWSFFATVKSLGHLPASPDEAYLVVYLTLVVLFTNQAYYGLVNKVFPAIGDFIQKLFGKPVTTGGNG